MITPAIISVRHVHDYTVYIEFADGTAGEVDFVSELWGPVFEPLQDPALFRQFRLDKELNTIVWPTGADFAPEFLYESAMGARPAP